MRLQAIVLGLSTWLVVLSAGLAADEKPSEAYQQAMKDLGAATQALRAEVKTIEGAGAYPDFLPVAKHAATLKTAFTTTLAYWSAKQVDDAVQVTQAGLQAVADLEKAATEKSYDALVMATTAIGGTCGSCHKAHRVQTPDGTYEIK